MTADISLEEIKRWLDSIADPAEDIACRAYTNARTAHITGEKPKWCRAMWHDLKPEYREFLTSIARLAIQAAPTLPPAEKD